MDRVQADITEITERRELFEGFGGRTVMITGATGLIGSMLIKSLLAADERYALGIRIIALIRNRKKADSIFGGLSGKIAFTESYDHPCDFIVHTVSPTTSKFFIESPVETIKASFCSAEAALETAKKYGASLVYLSSMEQYGRPYTDNEKMTEDKTGIIDHLNIRSSYSESKRLCECLCVSYAAEYGVDVKIARLAQTFGAGVHESDNRMPVQFARAAAEGRDIVLHTEGRSVSNFVYLTDAVSGILTILLKGAAKEAYNVCNDAETRSVREIAQLVADETAGGRIKVRTQIRENMGYAPDTKMYLCSDRLKALGWEPRVGMAEAYARLAEYLSGFCARGEMEEKA